MQLIKFPVGSTNVFPVANSRTGNQLVTEFNLRSRETVGTPAEIQYSVGPSYAHSMSDFEVSLAEGSSTTLQISAGRALVNGHYFESLIPVTIDIAEENYNIEKEGGLALKGKLSIGLRAIYSTEVTMAGALLAEDEDNALFYGIQVVILPTYGELGEKLTTPEDSPVNEAYVNCHLRLASFTYTQGSVVNIVQNAAKISNIDASRITNINQIMDDDYVKKSGLIAEKLYTFSGKGSDPSTGYDTWCDSTDSLMVWDNNPSMIAGTNLGFREAAFVQATSTMTHGVTTQESVGTKVTQGDVLLRIPHKQPEGVGSKYYPDMLIPFPTADFTSGTSGAVTKDYTNFIKSIDYKINSYYRMPGGRMRAFIPILRDINELPPIPWEPSTSTFSYDNYITKLNTLQAKVTALQARLDGLDSKITTTINSKVNSTVTASLESVNNNVKTLTTTSRTLSTEVTSLNKAISELRDRVEALEGGGSTPSVTDPATMEDIYALQTQLEVLRTDFATVSDKYDTLQQTVNETLDNFAATIDSAKSEIEASAETSIEAKFAAAYAQLQVELDTIRDDCLEDIEDRISELAAQYHVSLAWAAGDYVLVGQDMTRTMSVEGRYPSTAYIVQPGKVASIAYDGSTGPVELDMTSANYQMERDSYMRQVPDGFFSGAQLKEISLTEDLTTNSSRVEYAGTIDYTNYNGSPNRDYFVARYVVVDNNIETITSYFYIVTATSTALTFDTDNPVYITSSIPFATENDVGGFLNVPVNYRGGGYVYRDDNGYLRLLDYDILSQGVLAYQLGADISFPAGIAAEEINETLDEYVNDRVAFPNAAHIMNGGSASSINISINLSDEDDPYTINIHNIDSRFGTAVNFTFTGTAAAGSVINFVDCEKIKIDVSTLGGNPVINVINCGLYYSSSTFNSINNISGLSLWYNKQDPTDANLSIDGMTVTLLDEVRVVDGDEVWSTSAPNDNHYKWGLRSITFSENGKIIGAGLVVTDNTTANVADGTYISVCEFSLPQGTGLTYPESKLTSRIKITGEFVTCYPMDYNNAEGYTVKDTSFSALTKVYSDYGDDSSADKGIISFKTTVSSVTSVVGITPTKNIDSWLTGAFHYFQGGLVD